MQPATIVQGDQEANDLFASINKTLGEKFGSIPVRVEGGAPEQGDPNCWWSSTKCTQPKPETGLQPDITTMPEPETWGFGFDDGPNCSHNALYNFLNKENQRATMFFIGSNVIDWPLQAIRAKNDGHEICVHTWSHVRMTTVTNEQAFAELYYTRKLIKALLGVTPKCWRPPYGDVDNRIRAIAQALNMTNIIWSDDTFDWQIGQNGITQDTVTANYQKVIDQAKQGAYKDHGPIVLNHEINNETMQEMVQQYPNIKAAFKNIVPVNTGHNITHPYVEEDIFFPNFDQYVAGTRNWSTSAIDGVQPSASGSGSSSGGAAASSGASSGASGSGGAAAASGSGAKAGPSSNAGNADKQKSGAGQNVAAATLAAVGVAFALLA